MTGAVMEERRERASRADERRLLLGAASRLAMERGQTPVRTIEGSLVAGGTSRELAALAGMSLDFAQEEIDNMCRRGELDRLGRVRGPNGNRPMVVYAPRKPLPAQPELPGLAMLDALLRTWQHAA